MENQGWLSTHVLDTANGCPGAGITVHLYSLGNRGRVLVKETTTTSDGRTDSPFLSAEEFSEGEQEPEFDTKSCFQHLNNDKAGLFLATIPVRFRSADVNEHYDVPLLVLPFNY
jgi:5-hydroxyisourate hydrolase